MKIFLRLLGYGGAFLTLVAMCGANGWVSIVGYLGALMIFAAVIEAFILAERREK